MKAVKGGRGNPRRWLRLPEVWLSFQGSGVWIESFWDFWCFFMFFQQSRTILHFRKLLHLLALLRATSTGASSISSQSFLYSRPRVLWPHWLSIPRSICWCQAGLLSFCWAEKKCSGVQWTKNTRGKSRMMTYPAGEQFSPKKIWRNSVWTWDGNPVDFFREVSSKRMRICSSNLLPEAR